MAEAPAERAGAAAHRSDFRSVAYIAYLEELKRAAAHGEASLAQAYSALYIAAAPFLPDDVTTTAWGLHPRLVEAFESTHGRIEESRYAHNTTAGAVLTRANRVRARAVELEGTAMKLPGNPMRSDDAERSDSEEGLPLAIDLEAFVWWQWVNFDSHEANRLLSDALHLRDRITTFLPLAWVGAPPARDIALRQVFGIVSELIQAIDEEEARVLADWAPPPVEDQSQVLAGQEPVRRQPPGAAEPAVPEAGDEERAGLADVGPEQAAGAEADGAAPTALAAAEMAAWAEDSRRRSEAKERRPSEHHVRQVGDLRNRLAETTSVYLESAQRLGQREYVQGMFTGLAVVVAPVVVVLAILTGVTNLDSGWVATAAAGAVGAILSVLQRMSRGPLDLKPEGYRATFQLLGAIRPVIGAVLGVASFVLVNGGLLSLAPPAAISNHTLYFAGIAFLAGFSERFAQDMLVAPSGLLKTRSEPSS
jgi:hypothetical protein